MPHRCCIIWVLLDGVGDVALPLPRTSDHMKHQHDQNKQQDSAVCTREQKQCDIDGCTLDKVGEKTKSRSRSCSERASDMTKYCTNDTNRDNNKRQQFSTPLELARTPHLDAVCSGGSCGLMDPVEPGLACGSDTAHLSLLGYDPKKWYRGRGKENTQYSY